MNRSRIFRRLLLVFLLLVVLGDISIARDSRLSGLSVPANRVEYDNAKVIQPGDDLIAAYNWLKSSDRDGQMGALSATNPRYLILTPGYYAITEQWVIDTSYVYVTCLTGSKYDTVVHRTGTSAEDYTAKITPCHLIMSGFTISQDLSNVSSGGVELEAGSFSNVCRVVNSTAGTVNRGTDLLPTEYTYAERADWIIFLHYQAEASGEITAISGSGGSGSTSTSVITNALTIGGKYADVVSFADGGSGTVLVTTDGAHGLEDNWKVSIGSSVYYDGSYVADYVDATSFKITKAWAGAGTATGNISSIAGTISGTPVPVVVTTSAAHGMLADGDTWVTLAGTTFYDGTYLITAVTSDTFTVTFTGFLGTQTGTWTRKIGETWENCVFGLVFTDFNFYDMCFSSPTGAADGDSSFWGEHFVTGNFYDCDGTGGFATIGIASDRPGCKTYCKNCKATDSSFGGDNQYQVVAARFTSGIDWSTYINCDSGSRGFAGCGGWGSHFGGYIDGCTGDYGCVAMARTMFGTVVNSKFGDAAIAGIPTGWSANGQIKSHVKGYVENVICGEKSFAMGDADCTINGATIINCRIVDTGLGGQLHSMAQIMQYKPTVETNGTLGSGVTSSTTGTFHGNHPVTPTNITAASYTVSAFDNGQTFTNLGAAAAVEFTLPPAVAGRSNTYVRAEAADTKDVLLTPAGSDTINGGADLDNTADEIAKCKLECLVTGNWVSTSTGTWN